MSYLANSKKNNNEPDINSGLTIIFIFLIVVGLIIYGVYDGFIKVPFFSSNRTQETTTTTPVLKKEVVTWVIGGGEFTIDDITINTVEMSNSTITVQAGFDGDIHQYVVPISNSYKHIEKEIYLPKEDFVEMNDGIHYLFAYDNDDFYRIGIAK